MVSSSRLLRYAAIAALALAFSTFLLPSTWRPGCDFQWRHNEVRCLRSGLDPYAVCFLGAESPEFCPVLHSVAGKKPVNGYSPWEYTWLLPLSLLPVRTAHAVFMLLNLGALALIAALARRRALRQGLDRDAALAVAAAACFLGLALVRVLQVSNYGLLMAAALMVLAEFPRAGFLALCVLMVKPQIGVLFTVPLLLSRRWRTVLAAAVLTGLSVLPASALCHGNPVRMVLRVVSSGTQSIRSSDVGTGLLPAPLVSRLADAAPTSVWLAVSAALGLGLCLYGSWRLRRHPDMAVRLLPAATISLLWMQGHFHDRVLLALPLALFAAGALRGSRRMAAAWFLFTAEFWLCLLGGVCAALFLRGSPMEIVQNPVARTAYDIALCVAGWMQIAVACRYPAKEPDPIADGSARRPR